MSEVPINISEFIERYNDTLESMGWIVQHDDECVTLHNLLKNGKLRETAIVAMYCREYETLLNTESLEFWDDDCPEDKKYITKKKSMPWTVHAKDNESRSFKKPDKAISRFMSFALQLNYKTTD